MISQEGVQIKLVQESSAKTLQDVLEGRDSSFFIQLTKEGVHGRKFQLELFDYTLALTSCNKSMKQLCSCSGKLSLCKSVARVCYVALPPSIIKVLWVTVQKSLEKETYSACCGNSFPPPSPQIIRISVLYLTHIQSRATGRRPQQRQLKVFPLREDLATYPADYGGSLTVLYYLNCNTYLSVKIFLLIRRCC